jgi:hypothetical protein
MDFAPFFILFLAEVMLSNQSTIRFIDAEAQSTALLAHLEITTPATTVESRITILTARIEDILAAGLEIQGLFYAIVAQYPFSLVKVCEALKGKKSVSGLVKLFNTVQPGDRFVAYRSLLDVCKVEQSGLNVILASLAVLPEWLELWACKSEEKARVFLDIADSLESIEYFF